MEYKITTLERLKEADKRYVIVFKKRKKNIIADDCNHYGYTSVASAQKAMKAICRKKFGMRITPDKLEVAFSQELSGKSNIYAIIDENGVIVSDNNGKGFSKKSALNRITYLKNLENQATAQSNL